MRKRKSNDNNKKWNNTCQWMDTRFLFGDLPLTCMKQGCEDDSMLVIYFRRH